MARPARAKMEARDLMLDRLSNFGLFLLGDHTFLISDRSTMAALWICQGLSSPENPMVLSHFFSDFGLFEFQFFKVMTTAVDSIINTVLSSAS